MTALECNDRFKLHSRNSISQNFPCQSSTNRKQKISEKSVGGQRQQTHIQSKKEQFSQKKRILVASSKHETKKRENLK